MFDLTKDIDIKNAKQKLERLVIGKKTIELKEIRKTRTVLQNSALHLFYTILSDQMNELGMEFHYTGIKGMELTMMWTPLLIKEFIWKPIQIAMFNIESTTKLTTDNINQILDVLTKYFGESGVPIEFPSKFGLYIKMLNKNQ